MQHKQQLMELANVLSNLLKSMDETETKEVDVNQKVDVITQKVLLPLINKPVLIRCNMKGTQVGIITETDSMFAYLTPSRKLWRWQCEKSIALESLAAYGPRVCEYMRPTAIVEKDAIQLTDMYGVILLENDIYDRFMALEDSPQD